MATIVPLLSSANNQAGNMKEPPMSEERAIDPVSRVLGSIEANTQTVLRVQAEDRVAAAQYRTDVRAELQSMRSEISAVSTDFRLVQRDVAEMKPKVQALEQKAHMSAGATNLFQAFGRGIHVLSAIIGGLIVFSLQRWLGK